MTEPKKQDSWRNRKTLHRLLKLARYFEILIIFLAGLVLISLLFYLDPSFSFKQTAAVLFTMALLAVMIVISVYAVYTLAVNLLFRKNIRTALVLEEIVIYLAQLDSKDRKLTRKEKRYLRGLLTILKNYVEDYAERHHSSNRLSIEKNLRAVGKYLYCHDIFLDYYNLEHIKSGSGVMMIMSGIFEKETYAELSDLGIQKSMKFVTNDSYVKREVLLRKKKGISYNIKKHLPRIFGNLSPKTDSSLRYLWKLFWIVLLIVLIVALSSFAINILTGKVVISSLSDLIGPLSLIKFPG